MQIFIFQSLNLSNNPRYNLNDNNDLTQNNSILIEENQRQPRIYNKYNSINNIKIVIILNKDKRTIT